jgi:hypothetical protein
LGKGAPTPFRPWRRSFDTLLRYRGTTLAELWRALRLFKALQAEAVASPRVSAPEIPIEPEARTNPGEITSAPSTGGADMGHRHDQDLAIEPNLAMSAATEATSST